MDKGGVCVEGGVRARAPQTSDLGPPSSHLKMLYLFSHTTLPWVKFGYTQGEA